MRHSRFRRRRRAARAPYNPPVERRRDPTLLQKASGHWFVRFRHEGRTKDKALGMATPVRPRDAVPSPAEQPEYAYERGRWIPRDVYDRFVSDYKTPYVRGVLNPWDEVKRVLLRDAVDEFLGGYDEGGHTHRSYRSVLGRLKEAVGDPHLRLDRVRTDDLALVADRPGLSAASRRSYRRQLRAFFNWALDRGYMRGQNPVDALPEPRAKAKAKFVYCGPDEFERVLREVDADLKRKRKWMGANAERHLWVKPVYELAVMTGLRRSELGQLQWQDVDLGKGMLEVREKSLDRDGVAFVPKSRASRRVEIFPRTERVLTDLRALRPEAGPLDFVLTSPETDADGAPLPANAEKASARWRLHRREAELSEDLKFHGLRHTFVSNLLLLGYAPFYVMAMAGHADISTTMGYAHFVDGLVSRRKRTEFQERLVRFGYASASAS